MILLSPPSRVTAFFCLFVVCLTGFLSAVRFLQVDQPFYVTWMPPATPNTDPITYCVAVHVNSASTSPLYSKCGISKTGFNYTLPPDSWCDVYFTSVSPVSRDNVRGTTSTIRYSRTEIGMLKYFAHNACRYIHGRWKERGGKERD